jgi:predicted amidohydrolase
VVGKYSKTHLPQEEAESGITAGDLYPVFDTDFGRIGITICWDLQFPEPFAAMARKGAELILLPIWGGNDILARARAIENHCYLVSSSYDMKSMLINPKGDVLAELMCGQIEGKVLAGATIDLEQPVLDLPWLGNLRGRVWSERRGDLYIGPKPGK